MNLISRASTAHRCLFSSHISRKPLFLPRPVSAFQQFSLYSTTRYTSSNHTLRAQQPKKPRTQKPSSPSSSLTWSQRVKKEAEAIPTWPRPREIPYQAKVANSVNLIGHIQMPVLFHATPDGKHMAATFISQENGNDAPSWNSFNLMIPIVFEGDLAHIVACHVKQNDCVNVNGKLCLDPLPFILSENQGKFHVLGQEINFVQGLERRVSDLEQQENGKLIVDGNKLQRDNIVKDEVGDRFSRVQKDNAVDKLWENLVTKPEEWWAITSDDGFNGAIEGFERKKDAKKLQVDGSIPVWVYKKLDSLRFDQKREQKKVEKKRDLEIGDKSEQKKIEKRTSKIVASTKDGDSVSSCWRDLVRNPKDWWDNREQKANGSLSAKFPDFKHKTDNTALWLNRAPNWVLQGLEGLEFDVQVAKGQRAKDGKGTQEDQWKSLVENPNEWWDNRSSKTNKRAPDFKNKETGEALWLNSSPEWVLSRLPPLKENVAT